MKSRTNSRPPSRSNGNHGSHHSRSGDGAREHYRREKARRAKEADPQDELIAAAKREYLALLESEAAKGKGGRPKKRPAGSKPVIDDELGPDEAESE